MKETPAAATAWQVEKSGAILLLVLLDAVLVLIAIYLHMYAIPATLLVMPVQDLMNAVMMMLFVKLFLGKGGFVYLNRTGLV